MKIRYIIGLIIVFAGIGYLIYNQSNNSLKGNKKRPETATFKIMEKPALCSFAQKQIENINKESKPLKNGDGYKAWDTQLTSGEKVYFITKNEYPYLKDQKFLVATNCKKLDKTELDLEKLKAKIENKEQCMNMYHYDTELLQIKLECGYITAQGLLFY